MIPKFLPPFLIYFEFEFMNERNFSSNISSNMQKKCWMKCWTGLLRSLRVDIHPLTITFGLKIDKPNAIFNIAKSWPWGSQAAGKK